MIQGVNFAASRRDGSCTHAVASACCIASSARPASRRMRNPMAYKRSACVRARIENASRSPCCAWTTRSESKIALSAIRPFNPSNACAFTHHE